MASRPSTPVALLLRLENGVRGARVPRTGAVDPVRPRRAGALRLNKEVQWNQ